MKPFNPPIGHSLEAYLRSRESVLGNKPHNLKTVHSLLRPHRRSVWDDGEVLAFREYKKRGD